MYCKSFTLIDFWNTQYWPRCFFCRPECDDCLWGFDNAMSVSAPSSVINIYRCFNNFVFCWAGGARAIMYSENISKHRYECHQGKQTAPSKVIFLVTSVIRNGENETEKLWKWSEATEMVFLLEIHFPTSRLSTLILSKCHHFRLH